MSQPIYLTKTAKVKIRTQISHAAKPVKSSKKALNLSLRLSQIQQLPL